VSLANKDTKFIDYQNAQIILIGAREGRDVIKNEIGTGLIRPLTEGKLE
jgi:hypothetical protein